MQVEIRLKNEMIGSATLDASDPPMGVASGPFEPSPSYQRVRYAEEIDGEHNPSASDLEFRVHAIDGEEIECLGVFIQDYAESLGEQRVSIIGIPNPEYEFRFGDYPNYKAYWDKV